MINNLNRINSEKTAKFEIKRREKFRSKNKKKFNFNIIMNSGEENTYDFEQGDELSDVKLIVEGKTLLVHKAILGKLII